MSFLPFKHLHIIELSSVLAGPLTGTFFAELGAKVIKIENRKTQGDVTRSWKSASEDSSSNYSAYYAAANYGKKSLMADLSDPIEIAQLYESIAQSDILLVNFKKGDAEKFGLDYARLKKINPRLIYAEITGFGADDPRTAYDAILQAETGYMSMNGQADGPSTKMPVALIDVLAAHQLKEGILVALLQRAASAKGAKVSVSLYDAAVASLANQASAYLMNQDIPKKMGSAHPTIAPYGDVFKTKDGLELLFAIGNEAHFKVLCDILEIPEIITDSRFESNQQRVLHRTALIEIIQDKVKDWKREALYFALLHEQIPVGCIRDMKEVFENDKSESLILSESKEGVLSKRVKTVIFQIES